MVVWLTPRLFAGLRQLRDNYRGAHFRRFGTGPGGCAQTTFHFRYQPQPRFAKVLQHTFVHPDGVGPATGRKLWGDEVPQNQPKSAYYHKSLQPVLLG